MRTLWDIIATCLVMIGIPCAIAAMVTVTAGMLVEGAGMCFVSGNWLGLLAIPIVVLMWYVFCWGLAKGSKYFLKP